MRNYLEESKAIVERYKELNSSISSQSTASDPTKIKSIGIELGNLLEKNSLATEYLHTFQDLLDSEEIIKESKSIEEKEYYKSYSIDINNKLKELEDKLELELKTVNPYDSRNCIMEIRAGTGGEEAALFASELFRMYSKYAEIKGWSIELMSISHSSVGGIKELICGIKGKNVYGELKYESGVHRVQRVPSTESSGRIHTSSASVVILPEAEEFEVEIKDDDLRIDLFRAGGPGGQSVNTTDSAVRITHIPSGIVVSCQDERSQLKNKNRALSILRSRIYDMERQKNEDTISSQRKSAIKTGDRSEKIRTYNYPQNRVTDHRIKVSWYSLFEILSGNIGEMISTVKEKIENEDVT